MPVKDSCAIVIFGASGDLTKRKLVPALFELHCQGLLPEGFAVLGVGRTAYSDEAFREAQREALEAFSKTVDATPEQREQFINKLFYESIDTSRREDYAAIRRRLTELDKSQGTSGNYLFYLSTPPALAAPIVSGLGAEHLQIPAHEGCWRRLIVEKPFGIDLKSATDLNHMLQAVFKEDQIFRIDHYLGKETVQNLLVFRFANGIFEPLWNRNYVDYVEITAAENIGVEDRGGYYEGSGALRDMVQNHMLQVVGMTAMEAPSSFDARAVRNETLKVFQSLRPITPENVQHHTIRGQYIASKIRGRDVSGYRQEKGVDAESRTETYAAVRFHIDNWRWGGVPFVVRTGKRLPTRVSEVVVHFKPTPHRIFGSLGTGENITNSLIIRIQPDEGVVLKFGLKRPGAGFEARSVAMDFHYSDLSDVRLPDAYERLLLDCLHGDATLFTRGDAVEACWAFVDPILEGWRSNPESKIYGYPGGTWGPPEADRLLGADGRTWRQPCKNLSENTDYCEL
ncbi:MAG: glucose-6-phosphate dehydrogenase [Myxococcales bacterium]|nr:glucose-6-phosphate dehydrogenase [Myxococcales bacterium]